MAQKWIKRYYKIVVMGKFWTLLLMLLLFVPITFAWCDSNFNAYKKISITTPNRNKEPFYIPIHNDTEISKALGYPRILRVIDSYGNEVPYDLFNMSSGRLNLRWIANSGDYYICYNSTLPSIADYSNCSIYTPCWETGRKTLFWVSDTFSRPNSGSLGVTETGGASWSKYFGDFGLSISGGTLKVNDTSPSQSNLFVLVWTTPYYGNNSIIYFGDRIYLGNQWLGTNAGILRWSHTSNPYSFFNPTDVITYGRPGVDGWWHLWNATSEIPIAPGFTTFSWIGRTHKLDLRQSPGYTYASLNGNPFSTISAINRNWQPYIRSILFDGSSVSVYYSYTDEVYVSRNEFYVYESNANYTITKISSLPTTTTILPTTTTIPPTTTTIISGGYVAGYTTIDLVFISKDIVAGILVSILDFIKLILIVLIILGLIRWLIHHLKGQSFFQNPKGGN